MKNIMSILTALCLMAGCLSGCARDVDPINTDDQDRAFYAQPDNAETDEPPQGTVSSDNDTAIMGYIHNFDKENRSFDLEEAEWLSLPDDEERLRELEISYTDLPNNFYVYRHEKDYQPYRFADNCKFVILNESMQHDVVDFNEFANNIHDYAPYDIEVSSGNVVSVTERYIP